MELDVTQFGRNGTYTLFIDESQLADVPADSPIYCIAIQSRYSKAPVNTLVRIDNVTELRNTFGKRDKAQERKGNYSMILAELLLSKGQSIFCINLRDYSDTQVTELVSLSTNNEVNNQSIEEIAYKDLFDKSTFWKLDREKFKTDNSSNGLNFSIVSSGNLTMYVRAAQELPTDFDLTISEHKERFPSIELTYLPDNLRIQDTFLEIWIFGKDLTNNVATNNPALANYIDNTGAVVKSSTEDSLEALSELQESGFITKITGTVAQEILSIAGDSYYLENLVNGFTKTTGLALQIDLDVIQEHIDWDDADGAQPLSAAWNALNISETSGDIDQPIVKTLSYDLPASAYASESVSLDTYDGPLTMAYWMDETLHTNAATGLDFDGTFVEANGAIELGCAPVVENGIYRKDAFYVLGNLIDLKSGDYLPVGEDITTANILNVQYLGQHRTDVALQSEDLVVDIATNLPYPKDATGAWIYPSTHPDAGQLVTFTASVADDAASSGTPLPAPTLTADELEALQEVYGKFTDVNKVTTDKNLLGLSTEVAGFTVNTTPVALKSPITKVNTNYDFDAENTTVVLLRTPEARSEKYTAIKLSGVTLEDTQFCDGTSIRQNEVLDLLNTSSLRNGLLDTDRYGFKILVDGFKTYIEQNAKIQLAQLAAESKRYAYLASMPFMRDFRESLNPLFKESITDTYTPEFIVAGGNFDLPFTNIWSMVTGEENGDFATGYFSSNLLYSDGITSTELPGGPLVALNYGDNFVKNSRTPYDPIGGNETGLVQIDGIIGLSHEFSRSDRDVLEPAGYNLIIRNAAGDLVIFNAASAKQKPKSALSNLENTFLINYVADEIDQIIKTTPFKRNTKELRDAKLIEANKFCDRLVADGAIGRYQNICDESNNTADLRNRGYFVLDTILYTTTGIRIAVNRIIVRKDSDDIA